MDSFDAEIRVFPADIQGNPLKFGLVCWPSMQLACEAVDYLYDLAMQGAKWRYQRNIAYSLSHYLTYCLNRDPVIDFRRATATDLCAYRDAMLNSVSAKTGEQLAPSTVALRVRAVTTFYEAGIGAGWNYTALDLAAARIMPTFEDEIHLVEAEAINKASALFAPRGERTETDIRPLDPDGLDRLLMSLGPPPNDDSGVRPLRDRLVAEWLVFTGMRITEALGGQDVDQTPNTPGLRAHAISALVADPDTPFDHVGLKIRGKFGKVRTIAVPMWLVMRTQGYIRDARAEAARKSNIKSPMLFLAGNNGSALRVRMYQKIFARACEAAGLTRLVVRTLPESAETRLVHVARHSPHGLRHTYAVSTYFSLTAQGSTEPWKLIQAQLGHKLMQTTVDTYLAWVSAHSTWGKAFHRATSVRQRAGIEVPHEQ